MITETEVLRQMHFMLSILPVEILNLHPPTILAFIQWLRLYTVAMQPRLKCLVFKPTEQIESNILIKVVYIIT